MNTELFHAVYNDISDSLNDIDNKRNRTFFFQKIMWATTGLYLLFMLLNMLQAYFPTPGLGFLDTFQATDQNPYATLYPVVILVVILYPTTYYFTRVFKKFKEKENATITHMVRLLFPNVEFAQDMAAPGNEIANSKIFAWIGQSTSMANYGQIRSATGTAVVNIADIGIIEETPVNKLVKVLMMIPGLNVIVVLWEHVAKNIFTNKAADNVQYTFRGMFSWLPYPKKLEGHTVVLTNKQKLKIDRLASFHFREEQKVHLEDVRFTDKFVVYSTDQVEARYVLSTSLMERIVTLEEKFNRAILLSFHSQKMYLAVENAQGLFAFPSGRLNEVRIVEELANDIQTALDISVILKIR